MIAKRHVERVESHVRGFKPRTPNVKLRACVGDPWGRGRRLFGYYAVATGILPIFACHSFGPVLCTEVPPASTATVTGMSTTSNS